MAHGTTSNQEPGADAPGSRKSTWGEGLRTQSAVFVLRLMYGNGYGA